MNYLFLRNVLDMAIKHYQCPQCGGKIEAGNLAVIGIDAGGVAARIICPHCQHDSAMRAEMNVVAAEQVHDALKTAVRHTKEGQHEGVIQDEDIVLAYKLVTDAKSVNDLLN